MERTIKVTGKGKLSVKPDLIQLSLNLSDVKDTYALALEQSSKQTEELRDCFAGLGFAKTDLKTVYFNVDTKYESYTDENRQWKQKFVGYQFMHSLKLEFDADNELLGKVLYALAQCSVSPEFNIRYTVKEPEKAKNELLSKAVADSKAKAEILAAAAGVKLDEIVNINYSWGEIDIVSQPMNRMLKCADTMTAEASYSMDIEPEDINITDTVTVIWEIN